MAVENKHSIKRINRRDLLKGAAAAAAAPVLASCIGQQGGTGGATSPAPSGSLGATGVGTRPTLGGNLNILQWSHFVPDFDTYLDGWAKKWGDTNGVKVTIDRIPQADLPARFAAEAGSKSGHDLIAHFANGLPALFKDSLVDVTDIANRAADKYGGWIPAGEAIGKVQGRWSWIPGLSGAIPVLVADRRVVGMAEARGHPITFTSYLRYGMPATQGDHGRRDHRHQPAIPRVLLRRRLHFDLIGA